MIETLQPEAMQLRSAAHPALCLKRCEHLARLRKRGEVSPSQRFGDQAEICDFNRRLWRYLWRYAGRLIIPAHAAAEVKLATADGLIVTWSSASSAR